MFKEPILICPRVFLSNEIVAATLESLVVFNITGLVNASYPQCECHYLTVDLNDSSPISNNHQAKTSWDHDLSLRYLPLSLDGSGEWKPPVIGSDVHEVKAPGLLDQLDTFFDFAGVLLFFFFF
jgi:hypothetical protein